MNVERSLKFGDELGGHQLSGHVDCTAIISKRIETPNNVDVFFQISNPKVI